MPSKQTAPMAIPAIFPVLYLVLELRGFTSGVGLLVGKLVRGLGAQTTTPAQVHVHPLLPHTDLYAEVPHTDRQLCAELTEAGHSGMTDVGGGVGAGVCGQTSSPPPLLNGISADFEQAHPARGQSAEVRPFSVVHGWHCSLVVILPSASAAVKQQLPAAHAGLAPQGPGLIGGSV
jgi:hypothetical protein